VASEVEAEQCDDDATYCAIGRATGNLGTSVRCRGTSDRFPRDCRAPNDGSIHETCGGASNGWTGELPGRPLLPRTNQLRAPAADTRGGETDWDTAAVGKSKVLTEALNTKQ
jgi:hypothetical protein